MQTSYNTNNHNSLILLIISLVSITLIYQLRPYLDDSEFMWISVPSYSILPGLMVLFSSILAYKLRKQKHFQAKAFLFFALGASCWFIAEQIWATYDHVFDIDPFPSIADIFYISVYPFYISFLLTSLKPIRNSISRKVWIFATLLSISFLVPAITASYDDMLGEHVFDISIALAYPILSSIQLIPAIVGVLFLAKKGANYSWLLLVFGFIMYAISDNFFLFAELDGTYYDGHPVDLMFIYSFILFIFSMQHRLKLAKIHDVKTQFSFFSKDVKFDTINKYGVPLTLIISTLVVIISLVHIVNTGTEFTTSNLVIGVVIMLGVFVTIILAINTSQSKFVEMKTRELENQKENLENLVEEKTRDLLKSERLSAIGELSGRLAHDLKNPLSVIQMSIDLIKQHPADAKLSNSVILKRLDFIERSVERISHQINDVLDFVRLSPLKLETISIRTSILNAINKINVPHEIKIKISNDDEKIQCDSIKMEAVFINLILNAIQAVDKGEIQIKIHSDINNVFIDFIDSGSGIPEDSIDKIFEPLFTTKHQGTGLGLASCKNIVEQHGGIITVKNNPTTFTIRFPKYVDTIISNFTK